MGAWVPRGFRGQCGLRATALRLPRHTSHSHDLWGSRVALFGQAILEDPMIQAVLSHRRPRVLIPRALAAREILPEILRNAGCIVDIVPVYETRPATMARRMELISRLEGQTIDCVMLTSSSSVNGLVDLLGSRSRELLRNLLVASIGPITTSSARRHGLCVGVTSDESTVKALLSAIELHFGKEV